MGLLDTIKKATQSRRFNTQSLGSFVNWLQSPSAWSHKEYIEQYEKSGYVHACISAISEKVGTIDLYAKRQGSDGDWQKMKTHPVVRLLENPNDNMSAFQLMELSQTYVETSGEFFWYLELGEVTRLPRKIHILRPDLMEVAIDKETGEIVGYTLNKGDGTKIPFEVDEIIHLKTPNPINPYRGMGTVQAASDYIQTDTYATGFTKNSLFNNAQPAGIVSIEGNMGAEDFEQVKRKWKETYGGTENAGKVAFLNKVKASFTKIGMSLDEVALKELKNLTRDDIMTMFRVSKPILGIFEDVNLASAKTAHYVFMKEVIDPKMNRIIDTINTQLMQRYGKEVVLDYISPVPQDVEEKIQLYNAGLNKWMTINEVRELEGLDPVDGGEVLWQPINLAPLSPDPLNPKPAADANKGKIIIRRTVKQKAEEAPDAPNLEFSPEQKEIFRLGIYKTAEQYDRKLRQMFKRLFTMLEEDMKGKMNPGKKDYEGWMFDKEDVTKTIEEAYTPIVLDLAIEQGQAGLDLIGFGEKFEVSERIKQYIHQRVLKFAPPMLEGLQDELSKALTEGIQNGESMAKLMKRVEKVYGDYKGYRAERISRTETATASTQATIEAYKQSAYVNAKKWFTNPGACEFCRPMNGKIVALDSNFAELGQELKGEDGSVMTVTFESVAGPTLHPNCECALLPTRVTVGE